MVNMKTKAIIAVITIGLLLIIVFKFGLGGNPTSVINNQQTEQNQESVNPAIISSDPPEVYLKKPLIVPPTQVIKLNFSVPLQNAPEVKMGIDPPHEIDVKLSDDYKTFIITPKVPYKLGQGYSLFIRPDTKLREEGKVLGKDYDFRFDIIKYSGI